MKLKSTLITTMFSFCLAVATSAFGGADTNTSNGGTIKGSGLAVHGYDVVGFFTENRPVKGSAKFSLVHNDATYRFTSQDNLDTFENDPSRYAPQYGGFCAYGVSVGAKFDGDPEYWKIVDGKLYLNLNSDIQKTWLKDISGNNKKASKNWRKIKLKTPAELS